MSSCYTGRNETGTVTIHILPGARESFVVNPLDEGLRRVLTTIWEKYHFEESSARFYERQCDFGKAVLRWRDAKGTAVLASAICFDLFGDEGPEHLHSDDCALGVGHCPIEAAC